MVIPDWTMAHPIATPVTVRKDMRASYLCYGGSHQQKTMQKKQKSRMAECITKKNAACEPRISIAFRFQVCNLLIIAQKTCFFIISIDSFAARCYTSGKSLLSPRFC